MTELVPCSLCKRPVDMDTANIFEEQISLDLSITPRTFFYHNDCTTFLDQSGQNCSKCSICGERSVGSAFGDLNLCFDDGCIHRVLANNKENLPKHYHHCKYHQFNKAKFLGDF